MVKKTKRINIQFNSKSLENIPLPQLLMMAGVVGIAAAIMSKVVLIMGIGCLIVGLWLSYVEKNGGNKK